MADQSTEQAIAAIWQLFKETDARLDQRFAETSAEIAKTNQALRKLEGLFGNQWGRLIEALVRPGVLKLFQDRGHAVQRLHQRSEAHINGTTMETDIILENSTEVITVEVKSLLTVEHVNEFLADLAEFTRYFPAYANYHVYGAVAGLDIAAEVAQYAYRQGLFVISITGDDLVSILNDEKFQPRDFGVGE